MNLKYEPSSEPLYMPSAFERTWHIYDSQGQILALAFRCKSLKPFTVFPLHYSQTRRVRAWVRLEAVGS